MKKIKGFYVLWPNYNYIDKLVDAGINTLIVTYHDMPYTKPYSLYYDDETSVHKTLRKYKDKVENIYLCPVWVKPWVDIPLWQRWKTKDGKILARTPCPVNIEYIESRIYPAINLYKMYNLQGIIWDIESYDSNTNPEIINPYSGFMKPSRKCYCNSCIHMNRSKMWKFHHRCIKDRLNRVGVNGQMPDRSWWVMRNYPNTKYFFVEDTYKSWSWSIYLWHIINLIKQEKIKFVAGAWIEFFSEDKYLKYLKKLLSSNFYSGYWIYSHYRFGNKNPSPSIESNLPYTGNVNNGFFKKLSKINS